MNKLIYYVDVIKNSDEIYIIDSCFTGIILPFVKTNKLKTNKVQIILREEVNKYVTIDYFGSTENLDYNNLLSETPPNKLIPLPSYPTPTKDDYKIGEFQRYFVKQINALIYIEVSQNTYDNIFTRNSSWSYEPYLTISIPWQLVGTKNEVEEINKKIVLLAEVDNKVFGFGEYIIITGGVSKLYI